jgi:hypothetical protein
MTKIDIKYEMTIELEDLELGKRTIKLSKKDAEDLYNALFYALGKQTGLHYAPGVRDIQPLSPWPTMNPSPIRFGEIMCSVSETK